MRNVRRTPARTRRKTHNIRPRVRCVNFAAGDFAARPHGLPQTVGVAYVMQIAQRIQARCARYMYFAALRVTQRARACTAAQVMHSTSCVVAPSGGPQGHNSLHDCTGRGHIGWKRGEVVPETIYTTPSRCMQTPCTSHTTYTTYTAGTALTVAHAPHSKLYIWGWGWGLGAGAGASWGSPLLKTM